MPRGVVEIRKVFNGPRRVRKPFIKATDFEVLDDSLRRTGWGAITTSDVDEDLDVEYDISNGKATDVRRYAAIPQAVRRILEVHSCGHPGLALDKFVHCSRGQSFVRHALQTVVDVNNGMTSQSDLFPYVSKHWHGDLNAAGADTFAAMTLGPTALHLSRASALENAGICLHPLYGFVYLPGSGLKGMARAFAETVWLSVQTDAVSAWRHIEDVFGWAPTRYRREQIDDRNHPAKRRYETEDDSKSPEIKAHVGNVVFHDAWPESWPKLIVDIVNNHHSKYYQGNNDCSAPGDWENPIPVYFLAVVPETKFTFALSKRCSDVDDSRVDLARQWLLGALCHLGAGAKTNAGYGAFQAIQPDTAPHVAAQADRRSFSTTLTLTSPGFLAGANQKAEDCDLRAATLRGQLRWWWRTLHSGFMTVNELRLVEAAIWGDTHVAGAVRVIVSPSDTSAHPSRRTLYDKSAYANFPNAQKVENYGIPDNVISGIRPEKTTQGLWYASFGMHDGGKQRHVREPGARWIVQLMARSTRFHVDRKRAKDRETAAMGPHIESQMVLDQAIDALRLLCTWGGVGAKSGKGFGSLAIESDATWSLESARQRAAHLRQCCGIRRAFCESDAQSSSLELMISASTEQGFPFEWPEVWSVLDQVGFAYQAIAKKHKRRREKQALGLPRRVQNPSSGDFHAADPVNVTKRHTSPVHVHVDTTERGYRIATIAFPAARLPDLRESQRFLAAFMSDFSKELQRRSELAYQPAVPGAARAERPEQGAASPRSRTYPEVQPRGDLPSLVHNRTDGKRRVFKVERTQPGQSADAQWLRPAANASYQMERNWKIAELPQGCPVPAYIVGEVTDEARKLAKCVEIVGIPPQSTPSPQQQRPGSHGRSGGHGRSQGRNR